LLNFACRRRQLIAVARAQRQPATLVRQCPGNGLADSLIGPGDYCDLSGETLRHESTFFMK
jgi:hypothetical protein